MNNSNSKQRAQDAKTIDFESKLLDDIEKTTARMNAKSQILKNTANQQVSSLDTVQAEFMNARNTLSQESKNIIEARDMRDAVCWMYGVIAGEIIILLFLLWIGLS
eukprot:gene7504-10223_t